MKKINFNVVYGILALAAVMLLAGCINPFEPRTEPAKDGVGYFALSINGGSTGDRTIQPKTVQDDFVQYLLEFFAAGTENRIRAIPLSRDQLRENQLVDFIELPVGEYDLMVTAYLEYDPADSTKNKAAAKGGLTGIEIVGGKTGYGDIKLNAINEGYGIFSWDIDYPEGATAEIKIDTVESSGQTAPITLTITDAPDGEDENQKGKKDSYELRSGTYRVTFKLVNKDRSLEYSEILQVYQNMTSHFAENFIEDYFVIKRVQKIELVTAEVETYVDLPLTPQFTPTDATFTEAVWKIGKLDGSDPDLDKTGAVIKDGVFYAEGAEPGNSTVYVLATVEHGKGYGMDYIEQLAVTVKFVPVDGLTLSPSSITVDDGLEKILYVTISPWNATNKNLTWEIGDDTLFDIEEIEAEEETEVKEYLITGKIPGTTTLMISSLSNVLLQARSCTVKVNPVAVERITLSAPYIYLTRNAPGNSATLHTVVAPPNATEKGLIFTSRDPSKVRVNAGNGFVEVIGGSDAGGDGALITVTSEDSAYIGGEVECQIYIVAGSNNVADIEMNTEYMRLEVGSYATLIPFILPKGAETDVFWTSGYPEIASLVTVQGGSSDLRDPSRYDGRIKAESPGRVAITATTVNGGKVKEFLVDVYEADEDKPAVTGLSLSQSVFEMTEGNPRSLAPYINITPSNADNKKLYWRSDNTAVASVDANGMVTAYNPGETSGIAHITVTTEDGGCTATFTINVLYLKVEKIEFSFETLMMNTTNDVTLIVTFTPFNATNKKLTWGVTQIGNYATVDTNGKVHYNGGGNAIVKATSVDNPEAYAECTIRARTGGGDPVQRIGLDSNKLRVAMNGPASRPLSERVVFTPPEPAYQQLYWFSDDEGVATVSDTGQVSPVSVGEAKITVMSYDGGYIDTCDVEVYAGTMAVTGITLNTDELTLTSSGGTNLATNGRTAQLISTITPNGAASEIIWKSRDPAVATVVNGLVTAIANANGTAVITATTVEGGFMKSCLVTVNTAAVAVTAVRLSTNALDLEVGTNADASITSYVMPENQETTPPRVRKWHSLNTAVATVDDNGLVRAVTVGDTTIIATTVDGGKRENVAVRVREKGADAPAATGVKLNNNDETITLYRTKTATLQADIMPIVGWQSTAANQNIYWSSSDTRYATVDQNGLVTTVFTYDADRTVTIMATTIDGGYTDTCCIVYITQNPPSTAVTGLTVNMRKLTLNMRTNVPTGELKTGTILANITPSNATNKNLIWKNSNPEVATLDEVTGMVAAVAIGKTFIQVTTADGGYTQRVDVEVVAAGSGSTAPPIQAVNTVTINPSTLVLRDYTPVTFTITVLPVNAANDIVLTFSNPGIVTIDDGMITYLGDSAGNTTTITATSLDGGKISNTCTVTIRLQLQEVLITGNNSTSGNFYMGKYPITQAEYQTVRGNNPSRQRRDNLEYGEVQIHRPVENVSWSEAVYFCNQLSIQEGLTPAYALPSGTPPSPMQSSWVMVGSGAVRVVDNTNGYRLPTADQWVYAARAGKTTNYSWGNTWDDAYGWISTNSGGKTHQVGLKLPNDWGLHDMYGNYREWIFLVELNIPYIRWFCKGGSYNSLAEGTGDNSIYAGIHSYPFITNVYAGPYECGFRVIRPAP